MGKGELKIIVGQEKTKQGAGSTTILVKDDPNPDAKPYRPKGKTRIKLDEIFAQLSQIRTRVQSNKICFRLTMAVVLTITLIGMVFLTLGVIQYVKAQQRQSQDVKQSGPTTHHSPIKGLATGLPKVAGPKSKSAPKVVEKEKTNKTPKEKETPDSSAKVAKVAKVAQAKLVKKPPKFQIGQSSDHCNHFRHDETCGNYSVLHNTKTQWSAIADHWAGRCLLFHASATTPNSTCPKEYPWILDKNMGVLPRILPKDATETMKKFQASYKRVSRCVLTRPVTDTSMAGEMITKACSGYPSYRVVAVFVVYQKSSRKERAATKIENNPFLKKKKKKNDKETKTISYSWLPSGKSAEITLKKGSRWITTTMDNKGKELKTTDVMMH